MKKGSKIREITLRDDTSDRVSVHLVAKIDDEGNLVLEGYDIGQFVKQHRGDSDYEYWRVVDKAYKDTMLL